MKRNILISTPFPLPFLPFLPIKEYQPHVCVGGGSEYTTDSCVALDTLNHTHFNTAHQLKHLRISEPCQVSSLTKPLLRSFYSAVCRCTSVYTWVWEGMLAAISTKYLLRYSFLPALPAPLLLSGSAQKQQTQQKQKQKQKRSGWQHKRWQKKGSAP